MNKSVSALLCALVLAGCNSESVPPSAGEQASGKVVQGFQATFYEMTDAGDRWLELAISVDGDKTFRMPVFFSENGSLVQLEDAEARGLIDKWLKQRAANIAAFGSIDGRIGVNTPFLAIDRNRP